ncbi:MAG: amidohydrolase [Clostridiales bacterium]|nr:amidohydrolase [Clostridiales bacterium]
MSIDIEKIKASVDEVFDDVVSIRRHIHMNPDLSEQ